MARMVGTDAPDSNQPTGDESVFSGIMGDKRCIAGLKLMNPAWMTGVASEEGLNGVADRGGFGRRQIGC